MDTHDHDNDAFLINEVIEGDRERYGELVERYQALVYAIAWSRLGNHGFCEDAAQETFVKAFKYLSTLRHPEKFAPWLARIARNVSVTLAWKHRKELVQHKQWQLDLEASAQADTRGGADESMSDAVRQAIGLVPNKYRECLVLFYLEDKSTREAAKALSISEAAFKTRLHRAREAMRGLLEDRIEESLKGLKPSQDLRSSIMALIPMSPIDISATGPASLLSLLKTASSALGSKLLLLLAFPMFFLILSTAVSLWFGHYCTKLDVRDLKPSPLQSHREKRIQHSASMMRRILLTSLLSMPILMTAIWFAPSVLKIDIFKLSSLPSVFRGGAILFSMVVAYFVYRSYRIQRTNRTAYARIEFSLGILFLIECLVFALLGYSTKSFSFIIILFAIPQSLITLAVSPLRTKTAPRRHDYSLFLRHAKGVLGNPSSPAAPLDTVSHDQQKTFALFLGKHYLICDHRRVGDALMMQLPPVTTRGWYARGDAYSAGADSWLQCNANGTFEALLGPGDCKDLHLSETQAQLAEHEVARTLETAFARFRAGESDAALAMLQLEEETAVFHSGEKESKADRLRVRYIKVVFAISLLLFAALGLAYHFTFTRMDLETARAKIMPIIQSDKYYFLTANILPPVEFVPEEQRETYRQAVLKYLKLDNKTKIRNTRNVLLSFTSSSTCFYNALRTGIITKEQCDALGINGENIRAAIDQNPEKERPFISVSTGPLGEFDALSVGWFAYTVACYQWIDCMDVVDREWIVERYVAVQVLPGQAIRPEYPQFDRDLANGLFDFGHCGLQETFAAVWTLDMLGALDQIDKEACIEGVLRFHEGRGKFRASGDDNIHTSGTSDNTYYAMEILRILDAWDRVPDFKRWHIPSRYVSDWFLKMIPGIKDNTTFSSMHVHEWIAQLHLEELRDQYLKRE
jgi:RNA polymerase sigma-70 factor, ECF subfamily